MLQPLEQDQVATQWTTVEQIEHTAEIREFEAFTRRLQKPKMACVSDRGRKSSVAE